MVDFSPDLPAVVASSGKAGSRHADDRNAIIAALEALNGGGAPEPTVDIVSGDTAEGLVRFLNPTDQPRWTVGKNADGHFLVRRYANDGSYLGTSLFIVRETGYTYADATQVSSPDGEVTPLTVKHGDVAPTEAYFKVTDSADTAKLRVKADGCLEITPGIDVADAITKGQVKTIVAESTDFADFKTRMAAW